MKIVAILGGLGSQMFKYAFFLTMKKENKEETYYIDTLPFQLNEMWNGYELNRIFGIQEKDISEFLSKDEIEKIKNNNFTYRDAVNITISKLNRKAPIICILRGYSYSLSDNKWLKNIFLVFNKLKRVKSGKDIIHDTYPFFYCMKQFTIYYDEFNHTSDYYLGNGKNKEYFKQIFKFPTFTDDKNKEISEFMKNSDSVAIHVRRGDHMYDNGELFEQGYFKKSIEYMKNNIDTPQFFLFSDDLEWCKQNIQVLGFTVSDSIIFVGWNVGEQSFRDMQLMTYCKHNILAISSFSWWGYYLSIHEKKLVCAPKGYWLEVPVHF